MSLLRNKNHENTDLNTSQKKACKKILQIEKTIKSHQREIQKIMTENSISSIDVHRIERDIYFDKNL